MRRNNRLAIRISFLLVLAMGLFGAWYGATQWQIQPEDLQIAQFGQDIDWIDVVSSLGEEAIQLFLGLAGGS